MKDQFETQPINKLLLHFAAPAMLGAVIIILYSVIDRIFIGQKLGATALAGVTLSMPFANFSVALASLIGTGGAILISIKLGENKIEETYHIVGNQIILFLISCTVFTVLAEVFLHQLLYLAGATSKTLPFAVSYSQIFIPTVFFQCFVYGFSGVIRAQGFPRYAMTTSIIGAGFNIVLDYVFLFHLNLGVFGAGLATFLSLGLSALFNLRFLLSKKYPINLSIDHLKLNKTIVRSILELGAPIALIQFGNALVMGIYTSQLTYYSGDSAVAAYGIFMTVHSIIIQIVIGITDGGMQPILGYSLGAKKYQRIIDTIKITLTYTIGLSLLLMLFIYLFPDFIIRLFVNDDATINIGITALRYGFCALPIMVATIVIAAIYQSLGESKIAFIFNVMRKLGIIIPMVLLLPLFLGIIGIWLSRPIADTISFIIMSFYLRKTLSILHNQAISSVSIPTS